MIWKRYFLREFAKVFFLVIFVAYFLFVLIDYSAHTKTFHQPGVTLIDTLFYYFFQFTQQIETLICVALLLATIKVLTTLNARKEIVALAAGGISLKKLTTPFFYVALVAMALIYANFQWFEPIALAKLEVFEARYFKEGTVNEAHASRLKDDSLVLYHHYNLEDKKLHDLFWIKDMDHIYHMNTFDPLLCLGQKVELLERSEGIHPTESYETLFFPDMKFDPNSFLPKSLTQLMQHSKWDAKLLYKLTIPFAALFAVLVPTPFCLRFSRQTPIYLIYVLSLFGLIAYFTLVNAALILGQSHVIAPLWAMLTPPSIIALVIAFQCKKIC